MKTLLKDDPIIKRAHDESNKFTADEHLRDIYESRLKAQRDHAYFMKIAREEGRGKGMKEGIEKSERYKAVQTAHFMLKDRMSADKISLYTGLSIDEIMSINI